MADFNWLCLALFGRPLGLNRVLFIQSGEKLAALRTVKLSPALLIWLFRKTCTIGRSGGLVSACQRTHTARRPSALAARGPASHTEFPMNSPARSGGRGSLVRCWSGRRWHKAPPRFVIGNSLRRRFLQRAAPSRHLTAGLLP